MAYDTAVAVPVLMVPSIGGQPAIWSYQSGDARTTVEGASYFSDGVSRGMKVGDIVFVQYTTGYVTTIHGVASASGDAVSLAAAVLS
jgi:hypothetical protein